MKLKSGDLVQFGKLVATSWDSRWIVIFSEVKMTPDNKVLHLTGKHIYVHTGQVAIVTSTLESVDGVTVVGLAYGTGTWYVAAGCIKRI